jgi:hypothetical protein
VAQLATFTLDLALAPVTVSTGQAGNELFNGLLCSRPTTTILLAKGSSTTDQRAMPLDRFRLEDANDGVELPDGTAGH